MKKPIASVPHIETLTSCKVAALTENEIGDPGLASAYSIKSFLEEQKS